MADRRTSLVQEQSLGQHIMQSQVRYARLLEMTGPEVEESVERELEENPALEASGSEEPPRDSDASSFYQFRQDSRPAEDDYRENIRQDTGASMYDELLRQIGEQTLSPKVARAAKYLIGSLDNNGYLRRPLENLRDDFAISEGEELPEDTFRQAFEAVRRLEPHGIGATDLRDCLLLQLHYLPDSTAKTNAENILRDQFEAFVMKHAHKIISRLHISREETAEAIDLIRSLNPKPGAGLGGDDELAKPIIPDFTVTCEDGHLSISLTNSLPDLRINESFRNAVERMERKRDRRSEAGSDRRFITARYNDAKEFISLIRQRQETLFATMTAIVEYQKKYFETGDPADLRPMTIRDIAARTGYDISVISRATGNKYVATYEGILPLRYFFSGELGDPGEEYTNHKVVDEMRRLIEAEDKVHPLSDERLREQLASMGIDISRRTVAKYRDRMGIPVARLRKDTI